MVSTIILCYSKHCCSRNTCLVLESIKPLSAKITKWSNTLKQFVGKLPTNCLSVFDHFVGLALKVLSVKRVCLDM